MTRLSFGFENGNIDIGQYGQLHDGRMQFYVNVNGGGFGLNGYLPRDALLTLAKAIHTFFNVEPPPTRVEVVVPPPPPAPASSPAPEDDEAAIIKRRMLAGR